MTIFCSFCFSYLKPVDTYSTSSTLTLTVIDKLSLNVSSLNSDGVFATSDTGANNISVSTNNGTGYLLGIKASTEGGNALVNATDSSKTIPSHTISAGVSKTNYNDASYASANNLNNTWGFRPSTYYDTTNNITIDNTSSNLYFPGPSSTTNSFIIDKTSSANATANEYNLALGTRVNSSTAPGKYTDTFIITAVANPTIYSITYNQNTTDTVTNMPQNAINQETYGDSVNISNLLPVRDGFNFKGWCTVQVADGGTCSGITYNPDGGGTALIWTLDQTVSTNSLTLYEMWATSSQPLYDLVATQSKGTQTRAQLRVAITTDNSGVYEYNSSVFGTASDAANTSKIYYYRGILDNTTGSYGSDGDNAAWPNTVLLDTTGNGKDTSDTCWRIVRTTGSGGVKMIYQGKWTGSTCANSGTNANAVSSVYFNRRSTSSTNQYDTTGRIIYVGYNFSSTSSHQTGTSSVDNSTLFANGTKSNLRTQLESWYNSNMTAWTSKLEGSAGWCNDRTTYSSDTTSSKTTSNIPYQTSSATVNFGAYIRNATINSHPTLRCPNDTGYDLLTTSNGYIGIPSAPLTADEASFAGSGYGSGSTFFHANSYLRSGGYFWLLSPYYRSSSGGVTAFYVRQSSNLSYFNISGTEGVRPTISLTSGTTAVSGTGTAADPWIVNPDEPKTNVYCTNWSTCMQNTETPPACGTTMTDGRDGNTYTTATVGGTCWMTKNLRFTGTNLIPEESNVTSDITMSYGNLTSGNSYTEARIATGSTTAYGAYYNYCAASAGQACSSSSQTDATRSVCPAGWKLPTQAQLNAVPQFDSRFTASSGLAGYYSGGSLLGVGSDVSWWASTADDATRQYYLGYYGDDGDWDVLGSIKTEGNSIRCVRAN